MEAHGLAHVLVLEKVDRSGLPLAVHDIEHGDFVIIHEQGHEPHALGAPVHEIDIAGPDIVVAQVFHGAHAKALVAEQRVAHAEDADAAGHIFFRHEEPPFFGKERGGSG